MIVTGMLELMAVMQKKNIYQEFVEQHDVKHS